MHNQEQIQNILIKYGAPESLAWLNEKISKMAESKSSKDLFMTYSLLNVKFDSLKPISFENVVDDCSVYFKAHRANLLQVVADTGELETFLKYLVLLPNPAAYKQTAVEALRTNIAIIFDAISLNNPYPAKYFNDQQWNQMYLKAAFMERDLLLIESVDERANADLTRIISDYAHERWAASRKIDPIFWRPVSKFLNKELLKDMNRLLSSEDSIENKAGALCCYHSGNEKAKALLNSFPELRHEVADGSINWNTLKQK
ncbi:EboA domain-containing protein [Maribacter arcticus]|uniref:EboA domain-containing protein n=1 Tax=Maribacter arcticus TaxID=561365 RepID=UPI0030DA920B